MTPTSKLATVVTAVATLLMGTAQAWASEQFSFPSTNGAGIAAATPVFVAPTGAEANMPSVAPQVASSFSATGVSTYFVPPAPTSGRDHGERFGMRSHAAEAAYAYGFFTHALSTASYANYAADYVRLFAPGHAVGTWTDRMFGIVDASYGGPVDSWTAAAYYMPRVRGPARRHESAPDLSTMPAFRSHPELQTPPTFNRSN
jgi:hypothetical protein